MFCYIKIIKNGTKYDPTLITTNVGSYYILDVYQCDSALEKIPVERVDEVLLLVDGEKFTMEITNVPD